VPARHDARARHAEAGAAGAPPRRQPAVDAPEQARGRLRQHQQRGQARCREAAAGRIVAAVVATRRRERPPQRRRERERQQRQRGEQRRRERAERRRGGQQGDREPPLGRAGEREQQRLRLRDPGLEGARPPQAVVDARAAQRQRAAAVDAPAPGDVAGRVVLLRPGPLEQRLGATVAALLAPEAAHAAAAVVPHDGARMEAERPAARLQPPADVDVVAGDLELRIEAADRLQPRSAERHVAAGDVLGDGVAQQHVHGAARRVRDARGDEPVAGHRQIWAADARLLAVAQRVLDEVEPMRIGEGVVVEVGDELPSRDREATVARRAQAAAFAAQQAHAGAGGGDRGGRVGRAVVDDDHLVGGVREPREPVEALADRGGAVAATDDDRDARPGIGVRVAGRRGQRQLRVGGARRRERRRRTPRAVDEPEVPVEDVRPARVPRVGPGEQERAGAAACEARAHLRGERARLRAAAVAAAVEPELAHHQRPLIREVLQPRDVGGELGRSLEVDVVRYEVEAGQFEVLGAREARVGDERTRILLRHRTPQALEEALDAAAPVPAHDRGGDLVADGVREQRGVAGAAGDGGAHARLDRGGASALVEERHMLLPRQADEHPQPVRERGVEQPARRHRVRAQCVDAVRRHRAQVRRDARAAAVGRSVLPRRECSVGDAREPQALGADGEEPAVDARPWAGGARARTRGHRLERHARCRSRGEREGAIVARGRDRRAQLCRTHASAMGAGDHTHVTRPVCHSSGPSYEVIKE
jgi:hypothetical protein